MIQLSSTERQFIQTHLTDNVQALLLRPSPNGIDIRRVAAQIAARQKARDKLPGWYANPDLIFPPALSVEQASSEQTARYKASLVDGQLLLDLTGGMGVDTVAFSQRVGRVIYVEKQPELAELAAYNLPRLGASNVVVQAGDGLVISALQADLADWIYLDPHRRNEQGSKVVQLADCEPDLSQPDMRAELLDKANRILVKTSPLLDVDATVRQINTVEAVHIVAVQGEVKEILFVIGNKPVEPDAVAITAINLTTTGEVAFRFTKAQERAAEVTLSEPQHYLYEPNAAVLKAGAFRFVAARFGLSKLAPNSHLYTHQELKPDFPGRIFRLQHTIKPDQKLLQGILPAMKANLTVRNFPQTVAELRKKLRLQEGGDTYILATTLRNGDKRLLITTKAIIND